jgi:hypothetical protein
MMFRGLAIGYGEPTAWLKLVVVTVNTNSFPAETLIAYR